MPRRRRSREELLVDRTPGASISLADRLAFLADSGVVSPTARRLTEAAMADVEERIGSLDEDAAAALATHVAMALTRLDRREPPVDLPDVAAAELESRPDEQ